jgi:hypothetical protein
MHTIHDVQHHPGVDIFLSRLVPFRVEPAESLRIATRDLMLPSFAV